jgi:hypothetical protein
MLKLNGYLSVDEYGVLCCAGRPIVEDIQDAYNIGDEVVVCYYLTDKKTTWYDAGRALVLKTIGGNMDQLQFVLEAYSEFTIMELEQDLTIGGHNLYDELEDSVGKYLLLMIAKA